MTLEEVENIEDVVDCKIILIERMTASDNESIYYGIETASDKSVTPNIKCDNEVNKNNNTIESLIDLTGDDSDVDDDAECCPAIQDVKDEQHNICKMDDAPTESSNTSAVITSIESPREQENFETPVRKDDHSNLKSEEHITSGNNCSEHFDKKRSSVNDVLKKKYAGVDVIDIGDSDDDSDTESYPNSSLPYVTEKDNDAINGRDDSIEILSDSEHPSEEEETEVMFIKTTQPKHKIDHRGITKQQAERIFKRRRQESRAAFAKVSAQKKVSHIRVKYSIPYNETQRAAKLNDDEERQQKKNSASNERFQFHESAFEEQERLFRESAARVKAQEIAQQRYLQSVERIQFFSKPADVASLPSNHWKWSDPFSRLGVPKDCPVEIARRNYKKLCLIYHPDKAKSDSSLQFQAIKEAWESISSSTR